MPAAMQSYYNSSIQSIKSIIKSIIRLGFKYESQGICPFGGYPPPGALTDKIFPKVSAKKLTEKGGTPPLNWRSVPKIETVLFAKKNCFSMDFFL